MRFAERGREVGAARERQGSERKREGVGGGGGGGRLELLTSKRRLASCGTACNSVEASWVLAAAAPPATLGPPG